MNRILVVDDDGLIRTLLKLILSRRGFRVVSATNGSEAIRKFECGVYDLVITDICMPECDGNALADYIKAHRRSVPVIAYTGSYDRVGSVFDQIVHKPAKTKDLVDVAQQFLGQHGESSYQYANDS